MAAAQQQPPAAPGVAAAATALPPAVVQQQPSLPQQRPAGQELAQDASLDNCVEVIKDLQRTDQTGKEQWGAYCDQHGAGIRDPSRQTVQFVQQFLTQYRAGHRLETPQNTALADLVKEGQRRSTHWKQAWASYCQHYGGGLHDPMKHEQSFLVGFLDFLGQRGTMSFEMGVPMAMLQGGIPDRGSLRSRPRGAGPMMYGIGGMGGAALGSLGGGGGSGNPARDALAVRVKAWQRSGESQRQAWWAYCDEHLGGVRDPVRHEQEVLQTFLNQHGVP